MSGPACIAAHEGAGRVEPTELAVRVTQPTAAEGFESAPRTPPVPFAPGVVRTGPCELTVECRTEGEWAHLDLRVRNAHTEPLCLQSVMLGLRWRGAGNASLRFLRQGWQSWSYTGSRELDAAGEPPFPSGPWLRGLHHAVGAPAADRAGWHESDWLTVIGVAPAGPTCLVGALETGLAFGVLHLRRAGDEVRIELEQRLDAVLAPGETRELERVRVALGLDASALLEGFAAAQAQRSGARASAPFVAGWCSWYHFFADVCEADVLRNLEALAACRDELPVEVVQLDDGYQRRTGDWLETNEKFPRGLAPLAREIRAAGFVPGLWTAPFCAVAESRLLQEHRGWMLTRDRDLHRGLLHPDWARDGSVFVLDTSQAAVSAHLEALFRQLVEWGFSYLKLDFLYTAAMQADAADPGLSRAARLRRGLQAIRTGAGEEAFLLACGCPLGAAVGVADGMRIGPDVAPRWRADPAYAIRGIEETQPSTRSALRSIPARAWMHRRLWLNDPDCLLPGAPDSGLSPAEAGSLAVAAAATGGMALFSADLPGLSASGRALLGGALALAREVDGIGVPGAARAPDLLASEFASRVEAHGSEATILGVLNPGDTAQRFGLDVDRPGGARPEAVEALLGTRAPARDAAQGLSLALEPHESSALRVVFPVRLAVFCDFDGTFSVQDVGATLAQRHGGARRREQWARYEAGEITAWDYNMAVLHDLALPRTEVEKFLATVEIDPGAEALVGWCEAQHVPFRVLSDGFDHNLNRLQQLYGVRFAYDANRLRYERGRWRLAPGHPNPACGCGTGTCKGGRIQAFRRRHPEAVLVHVGNGRVSDLCGALEADHVFAKDSLALELEKRGVPFEPFSTLHDVIPGLERLVSDAGNAGTG